MAKTTKPTQKNERLTLTHAEWVAMGERLYGADMMDWVFVCPACGYPQTPRDYKAAGAPEGTIGFSCVGRYLPGGQAGDAFGKRRKSGAPCNYAGGGLFPLNPITVSFPDGTTTDCFAFADPDPAAPATQSVEGAR